VIQNLLPVIKGPPGRLRIRSDSAVVVGELVVVLDKLTIQLNDVGILGRMHK
jgi:hypothetical protein